MQINLAHLKEKSTSGGWLSVAIFDAKSNSGNNSALLYQLVEKARAAGLKVDKAALAFRQNGRTQFYGDKNLVNVLSRRGGVSQWTHKIDV
jgi:hypothetical protein